MTPSTKSEAVDRGIDSSTGAGGAGQSVTVSSSYFELVSVLFCSPGATVHGRETWLEQGIFDLGGGVNESGAGEQIETRLA